VNLSTLKRPTRTACVALAAAAVTTAITLPGLALAHGDHGHGAVPAPPAAPTSASQIQNIDQVKTAIKAYYGDTTTAVDDPVPAGQDVSFPQDSTVQKLHQYSPDSAYAHEVKGIASDAGRYLAHRKQAHHQQGNFSGTPSVLFDIDDTTLNTYSYEIYSNFVFNPTTNGFFVHAGSASVFPAVPGMVALEQKALAKGYQVFFLTGRSKIATPDQTPGTLANLEDAGYTVDPTHVYLKDATGATEPWLSSCAPTCTTTQYKSLTRQHIESLGFDIVAHLGDQFSDLKGGFADRTFKIPNPMYFLP
jgi:hypothetical protein